MKYLRTRAFSAASVSVLALGLAAEAQDSAKEMVAGCQLTVGDPFDPNSEAVLPAADHEVPVLKAYRYCEAAMRLSQQPSLGLQYLFGRAAFLAGDTKSAIAVLGRIDPEAYPAASGLILRLGMRNAQWASANAGLIERVREAARRQGYPAVDYHVGLAYEELGRTALGRTQRLKMYEKALQAYALASKAGIENATFKHAKMQLLHWNLVGRSALNETVASTMNKARDEGSAAAIFYQKAQAAAKAGPNDVGAIKESLTAWRKAFMAYVPEAVAAVLVQEGSFGENFVGVDEQDSAEKTYYLIQHKRIFTLATEDPVIADWLHVVKDKDLLEDFEVARQTVLDRAFRQGFTPAGNLLIKDYLKDPQSGGRKNFLLDVTLRTETKPYDWILNAADETFLSQDRINAQEWGLAAEIYRRLFHAGEKLAALQGALVMAKTGRDEDAYQWLEGFLTAVQEKDPKVNDKANAGRRKRYVQIMLRAMYDNDIKDRPRIHRKGIALDGKNYLYGAFEYYKDVTHTSPAPSTAKLAYWYNEAKALAALDGRAQAEFDSWLRKRLETKLEYAELRTKPKCEYYSLNYGGYDISADFDSFSVTRLGKGSSEGEYRYSNSYDDGRYDDEFLLFLKASERSDGPSGFTSKETWMRTNGTSISINYTGGFIGLGWSIYMDDAGDIRARDRALRGGSTDLQYGLKNGQRHSLVYNFSGFRQAYDHAQAKHKEIKRLFDRKQCRTF